MTRNSTLVLAAALLLPAGIAAGAPKCWDFEGACIAVTVNGQPNVKLGKSTKQMLASFRKVSYQVDDARYKLAAPIRGELEVKAAPVPGSESYFGAVRDVEVGVVPLTDVDLQSHAEQKTQENVRAGNSSLVSQQDVLDTNHLPPGLYLLVVTLHGAQGWDRQVLFFEAK